MRGLGLCDNKVVGLRLTLSKVAHRVAKTWAIPQCLVCVFAERSASPETCIGGMVL